jgi:uncharacterized protein YcnI
MQVRKIAGSALALASVLVIADQAQAHVSVTGPAFADSTFVATFSIGHGCTDASNGDAHLDTKSLTIEIPAGVTSVKPVDSAAFDMWTTAVDGEGNVTSVTYEKTMSRLRDGDPAYYTDIKIRMQAPDAPFTRLTFLAHQTCGYLAGTPADITVDWVSTDGSGEPAAQLAVLPARSPGWNKYTNTQHLHGTDTLAYFFGDALIVWVGDAGYSSNPETRALIEADATKSALTEIHPDSELWVRY